jgi:hypothetical protein
MMLLESIQNNLRRQQWWVGFQTLNREGWNNVSRRLQVQRRILTAPSIYTDVEGPVEIRVLTWKRDWINVLWALKSFYFQGQVTFPLYIHDGGLSREQSRELLAHFPNAHVVTISEADARVEEFLSSRGLERALAYRRKNPATRKLFDFYVFSQAEVVISIDSDILFFARPEELIQPPSRLKVNLYNKDAGYSYSMPPVALKAAFGFEPVSMINSGLNRVYRESIDFAHIDSWLNNPDLFADTWVTEQTLHALCSTQYGVRLLPSTYHVGTEPGFPPGAVCKHYPGYFRPLFYQEGIPRLMDAGFLDQLPEFSEKSVKLFSSKKSRMWARMAAS